MLDLNAHVHQRNLLIKILHFIEPFPVPPLPPTNLGYSRVSTRTARLSWRAPAVTFLNSLTSVSSYRIVARQDSFNISDLVIEVPFTQTIYSFPSTLEEFTEYSCEVHAGNSFGYGRPSQAVQFQTLEASQFINIMAWHFSSVGA